MKNLKFTYNDKGRLDEIWEEDAYYIAAQEEKAISLSPTFPAFLAGDVRGYIECRGGGGLVECGKINLNSHTVTMTLDANYLVYDRLKVGFEVLTKEGTQIRFQPVTLEVDEFVNITGAASGKNGYTVTVKVGAVAELAPGEAPYVENVGSEKDVVLSFGIPRGEKPILGEDYWTPEEQEEIKSEILDVILLEIEQKQPIDFVVNVTTTGSISDDSYAVESANKTYDEVLEAYNAGKRVYVVLDSGTIANLVSVSSSAFSFSTTKGTDKLIYITVNQDTGWKVRLEFYYTAEEIDTELDNKADVAELNKKADAEKVRALSDAVDGLTTEVAGKANQLDVAALADAIKEKQPNDFVVNVTINGIGTDSVTIYSADKTFEDVKAAYDAGKQIYLLVNAVYVVPLYKASTVDFYFIKFGYSVPESNREAKTLLIRVSLSGWSVRYSFEYTKDDIDEISGDFKDQLANKQPTDFVVNVTTTGWDYSTTITDADKTFDEVYAAYESGKRIYLLVNGQEIVPLTDIDSARAIFIRYGYAGMKTLQFDVSGGGWNVSIAQDYTNQEIDNVVLNSCDFIKNDLERQLVDKADKGSTLAEYGIEDAYQKQENITIDAEKIKIGNESPFESHTTITEGHIRVGADGDGDYCPSVQISNKVIKFENGQSWDNDDDSYMNATEVCIINNGKVHKLSEKADAEEVSNTYANALKKTVTGTDILIDDISPVTHTVKVKASGAEQVLVRGANMLGYTENFSITEKGVTVDFDAETQTFTMNGTVTETGSISKRLTPYMAEKPYLGEVKYTDYTLSLEHISGSVSGENTNNVFYVGGYDDLTGGFANWLTVALTPDAKSVRTAKNNHKYLVASWIYFGTTGATYTDYKFRVQFEREDESPWEPYNGQVYPVAEGGELEVSSIYPRMMLSAGTDGVTISCEYNRDINKAMENVEDGLRDLKEEWKLINEVELTEDAVVEFTTDMDGNAFKLKKFKVTVLMPQLSADSQMWMSIHNSVNYFLATYTEKIPTTATYPAVSISGELTYAWQFEICYSRSGLSNSGTVTSFPRGSRYTTDITGLASKVKLGFNSGLTTPLPAGSKITLWGCE